MSPQDFIHKEFVLDSSVFLSAFDKNDSGRDSVRFFLEEVQKRGFTAVMPMHGWFEVLCTWNRMKQQNVFDPPEFGDAQTYPFKLIHIDEDFIKRYGNIMDLPYIKGGDHIFLVYAKVNDIPLVTRDKKLFQVARESKTRVFMPEEYLKLIGVGSKIFP